MLKYLYKLIPVFLLLIFPKLIFAEAFSLSIEPQMQNVISQKDKTISFPYTVSNYGDPQVITLQIYKLKSQDSQAPYELLPYNPDQEIITFEIPDSEIQLNSPFLLKNKNTFSFYLNMTIPPDANIGDYYYTLVAESEAQNGFGNSSRVILQGAVGSHILLTVSENGAFEQEGSIVQFDILTNKSITINDRKFAIFDSYDDIPLLLKASNNGKNYARTSGSITIFPYFYNGKPKSEAGSSEKIFDTSKTYTMIPQYLLSETQGVLTSSENPVCDTENIPICDLHNSLVLHAPLWGVYRLSAVVSFGENAQIAYKDLSFIVFPYKISAVFLLSLIVIFILGRAVQKNFRAGMQ